MFAVYCDKQNSRVVFDASSVDANTIQALKIINEHTTILKEFSQSISVELGKETFQEKVVYSNVPMFDLKGKPINHDEKILMASDFGNWYGVFKINRKTGSYCIDNGEKVFEYKDIDDLLIDWRETLVQDDTVDWSSYIDVIDNIKEEREKQQVQDEPDITDEM